MLRARRSPGRKGANLAEMTNINIDPGDDGTLDDIIAAVEAVVVHPTGAELRQGRA